MVKEKPYTLSRVNNPTWNVTPVNKALYYTFIIHYLHFFSSQIPDLSDFIQSELSILIGLQFLRLKRFCFPHQMGCNCWYFTISPLHPELYLFLGLFFFLQYHIVSQQLCFLPVLVNCSQPFDFPEVYQKSMCDWSRCSKAEKGVKERLGAVSGDPFKRKLDLVLEKTAR